MCGGTEIGINSPVPYCGLSPRVRGNLCVTGNVALVARSIPACAGEPCTIRSSCRVVMVYPRVCGGTVGDATGYLVESGLSPRVRGNRRVQRWRSAPEGSIPACAGEPRNRAAAPPMSRVYPRVCGGTGKRHQMSLTFTGLSPRVRGNRLQSKRTHTLRGSIPACAGEPQHRRRNRHHCRVYPRVCGGTTAWSFSRLMSRGLSPRVRGNRDLLHDPQGYRRSIPACAGEPPVPSGEPDGPRVYPRVCGGTPAAAAARGPAVGLSPRVRGNPGQEQRQAEQVRSIPACAGEPQGALPSRRPPAVYPRVCGGTGLGAVAYSAH